MTPILKVITEYCGQYVDDIRLSELAVTDMPLYARRMYGYLRVAIPLFNLPMEMTDYLIGTANDPKLVEPSSDSAQYTIEEEKTSDFSFSLSEEYKGYELFSCRIRTVDNGGNVVLTPINATYDAETATVTIPASETSPIASGTILDMDFYTDGYFSNDLSMEIMGILGMCFQVVWQDRFNTDWLSMVSKVEDRSFYEQNRANKMNADSERLDLLRRKLAGEMRRYEQNQYRRQVIPVSQRLKI